MKYAIHFGPESLHIDMEGVFSFLDARLFHRMMGAIAANDSRETIKLDLSKLVSIDSTGIRLLMMILDAAKKNHQGLVLVGSRGEVLERLNEAAQYNRLTFAAA